MSTEESNKQIAQVLPLTGTIYGLSKDETEVTCPSCRVTAVSRIKEQYVTWWQSLYYCCSICISCCGKYNVCTDREGDFNHYCSNCGCFLGRYDKYYGGKQFCEY